VFVNREPLLLCAVWRIQIVELCLLAHRKKAFLLLLGGIDRH
jgi:hypothetical protein